MLISEDSGVEALVFIGLKLVLVPTTFKLETSQDIRGFFDESAEVDLLGGLLSLLMLSLAIQEFLCNLL